MIDRDQWKEFWSPTPVGLVVAAEGDYVNVAPGTWLQKVSYDPPVLMLSRKLGSDTDVLLSRRQPFVVSLPPRGYEQDTLLCSQRVPYGVSELTLPGVRFKVATRFLPTPESEHVVLLEPMLMHAVCSPNGPIVTVGDHRVFFAEVTELLLGTERMHPHNTVLHYKTKMFADVGPMRPCRGW